jgi:HK97 family phage major capsid protein
MPKDNLDDLGQTLVEIKQAFEAYKTTNDERFAEVKKNGTADPVLLERMTKIEAELDAKQAVLDKVYAASKRKNITLDGKSIDLAELDQKAMSWAQMAAKNRGEAPLSEYTHEAMSGYSTAFKQYMRKDERVLGVDEQKALSVGSDPDGGYLVSPDTSGRVVRKMFETSPMRQFASTQVISTDALEGSYDLDDIDFGWVAEKGARPVTNTPKLGIWRIPVHELYAQPNATQKMLDDSSINIESWLADKVASRFSRAENSRFVGGDGVGAPRGFLTYPDGTGSGKIKQYKTGVNGAFAATPNAADVLIDMVQGLRPEFRTSANFFMNRMTVGAVRKLKDSDGALMWQPSLQVGTPSTLLGYGVAGFEDMADSTVTGSLAIAFGDMAQAYQIVDRMGVRVLRDPYSAKPFVLFYSTKRVGGDVVDFDALNLLRFAA